MGGVCIGRSGARGFSTFAVAIAILSALATRATAVRAQQAAAPLVPIVTPLRADDLFASGGAPRVDAAFAPLRLTLTGGLFALGNTFPGCDSRMEASGNTVSGFAVQRYSYLPLAPQLVLHGFSSAGCPIDSGIGGGLTYAVPLRKSLWLVSSAGLYTLPTPIGAGRAPVTTAARIDFVKKLGWGRTLSLGLGARLGSGTGQFNALNFGGSF